MGRIGLTQWGSGIWSTRSVNDGQWHFLAITIDPSGAGASPGLPLTSLYLDGQLDISTTTLAINTALGSAAWIGQSPGIARRVRRRPRRSGHVRLGVCGPTNIRMLYNGELVPEPSSVALLGLGAIGLLVLAGRRPAGLVVKAGECMIVRSE